MNWLRFFALWCTTAALAQTPLKWAEFGAGGSVEASGGSAFAFSYDLSGSKFAAVAAPLPASSSFRRVRFRAKSDHATAIGFGVNERSPGGHYATWFWAPANTWQDIDLSISDFTLNDGPNDPPDTDGKLDPDQVSSLYFFDLAYFFNQSSNNLKAPIIVEPKTGKHTLQVDKFELLENDALRLEPGFIDSFERGFLQWFTLGGMTLERSAGQNPLNEPALVASYQQKEGAFAALSRRIPRRDFSHAKRLAFDVAAENQITLVVSLETTKRGGGAGPRYIVTVYPPGSRKPFHVDVSLNDFQLDPNSPVTEPAQIDPAHLRTIGIVDASTAEGNEPVTNRFWIGKLNLLETK